MKCLLVFDGVNVIGKEVYDGDDAKNDAYIAKKIRDNPTLTYSVVDQATLESTALTPKPTKDQTDWATAKGKGVPAAMDYLAQKLGLQ